MGPSIRGSAISATFSSARSEVLRLAVVLVVVVVSALTLLIPLIYLVVYLCKHRGKFTGIKDSVGLLLQPLILAVKAARGQARFNRIKCQAPHKLLLGAQPDKLGGFRRLFGEYEIKTVVSLNSEEERAGNAWMSPPTESDYAAHGIEFKKLTLSDHSPLPVSMLATAADKIHEGLQRGDVYVHCKAGQGRSAQAVVAYLLKHQNQTQDEAISSMQRDRPSITLKTEEQIARLRANSKAHSKQQERHRVLSTFVQEQCGAGEKRGRLQQGPGQKAAI